VSQRPADCSAKKPDHQSAPPSTPYQDITSAGPLTNMYIGNDLSAQVNHMLDGSTGEFYPPETNPGDSGTLVAIGGTLYAPDFNSHGGTATAALGTYTPFTPVSQTGVTGSGTASDPYQVITTVSAGHSGLSIQQTDSYIVGDESYETSLLLTNNGHNTVSGVLYRAGDSFLGASDSGYGFTEVFGDRDAIGCSVNPDNSPPGRIEEWIPLSGGNNFYEDYFNSIWSWIGTHAPFPGTCACDVFQDNGSGISWSFTIPAGASVTYSNATAFSPLGNEPLVTAKTADAASSPPGSDDGYTITINNPNQQSVTLTSISDTLPNEFSYIAGSSSGATTSDPTSDGQVLTWNGSFPVPANGSVSLHFGAVVATDPGDYYNQASGGASGGFTVSGTGPTAKITVTGSSSLALVSAASVKRGFAINLPLAGPSGVEDRSPKPHMRFVIAMTFNNAISSIGEASTTCGDVEKTSISGDTVTVHLINVPHSCNGSDVTVAVDNVIDDMGNTLDSASVTMGLLLGDVNGDRVVDSTDLAIIRADRGQQTGDSNYRADVTNDGVVNSADVQLAEKQLGTSLP
jgi:uncharacterized repeat protein (TIGR01451 family)